ncbi:MAG: hypothetical protein MIO93_15580, partial [ANME-2 cluster archaeon]|nr:hypothetical protein [ANME-2 cluster archaeon]
MSNFKDIFMEYIGEGEIIYEDDKIPLKFECQQLWDGSILGNIEIKEEKNLPVLYDLFYNFLPFNIVGSTNDGLSISIESIYLTRLSFGENNNIKFIAKEVKAKKRELISNESKIMVIFGITNFQSFRTFINTNLGELIFQNYNSYEKIIKDISSYKKACITGSATLIFKSEIKANSAEEYIKLAQKEINKVLFLTSFSQGIYQTWKFVQVSEKIDDENYEKIYFLNLATKDINMGFRPVTHFLDLKNYLSTTYPSYTDEVEKEMGIQFAIEWYLESLASNNVESKYIMAFVCLELLVDRYEAISGDKILEETIFDGLYEELKNKSKSFLKNKGIDDAKKRKPIYSNLKGLNRFPFREQFEKLLKNYKVGHTDIFKILSEPITVRDQLVHSGRTYIDFDTLASNYHKLMAMNQRIILSILNYDGQSFIDWLDNNKSKQF